MATQQFEQVELKTYLLFMVTDVQLQLFFFFFNWKIIALHYCAGFCFTSAWTSHRYTHVPSSSSAILSICVENQRETLKVNLVVVTLCALL